MGAEGQSEARDSWAAERGRSLVVPWSKPGEAGGWYLMSLCVSGGVQRALMAGESVNRVRGGDGRRGQQAASDGARGAERLSKTEHSTERARQHDTGRVIK